MDFTLYNDALKRFYNIISRLQPKLSVKEALNWLVPRTCFGCQQALNQHEHQCCQACLIQLPYQQHACTQCGQPLSAHEPVCGHCLIHPPSFDACFCPYEYQAPISQQIRQFKYSEQPALATRLAYLLSSELLDNDIPMPDALIAVPMHSSKLRERGFNQSHELAKALSKTLDIPLISGSLTKLRRTEAQASLSLKQRKTNLKGSFGVTKPFKAKHVSIIDDVVTTGATAEEIAKILKKNGVDYVQVWGIARTI